MKVYILNTDIDIEIFAPTYVYTGSEGWKTVTPSFLVYVVHTGYHNHKPLGIAWIRSILWRKSYIISTISEEMVTQVKHFGWTQMDIPWPREIVVYNDFVRSEDSARGEAVICHIVDEGDYEKIKGAI